MRLLFHLRGLSQLWRYYQVGLINTLVGYSLYACFVALGLNQYLAQIIAHILGMSFNYLTYSRHVFHEAAPAKIRFVLAYFFNYLVSLGSLAAVSMLVSSPYIAGALSLILASIINYFVLRHVVFTRPA